jgi:hypothetical protein
MRPATGILAHPSARRAKERVVSFFEFWPSWLFYAPVVAHWLVLGLRYRDFSLPTAANPLIRGCQTIAESGRGGVRGIPWSRNGFVA